MPANHSKRLGNVQLFTIAFGTIVGIAWVFLSGPWLRAAGSFGTVIALILGATLMLPVVWCYAWFARRYAGAGGELLYVGRSLGAWPGLLAGWALAFSYIALVAFHCVTVSWLIEVCLTRVGLGVGSKMAFLQYTGIAVSTVAFIAIIVANLRGVEVASRVQDVVVCTLVIATLAFALNAFRLGHISYLAPYFSDRNTAGYQGVLQVLATAPFLFGGFGTAVQVVSDLRDDRPRRMLAVLICAVMGAAAFYSIVVLSIASALPRHQLLSYPLPALDAFSVAFHSPLATAAVGAVALIALCTSWNGVFLAGWKIVAALAATHLLPQVLKDHEMAPVAYRPILFVAAVSVVLASVGRAGLIGIVTSIALAIAIVFLLMAAGALRSICRRERGTAAVAIAVSAVGVALGTVILAAVNLRESPTASRDVLVLGVWSFAFLLLALVRRKQVLRRARSGEPA